MLGRKYRENLKQFVPILYRKSKTDKQYSSPSEGNSSIFRKKKKTSANFRGKFIKFHKGLPRTSEDGYPNARKNFPELQREVLRILDRSSLNSRNKFPDFQRERQTEKFYHLLFVKTDEP